MVDLVSILGRVDAAAAILFGGGGTVTLGSFTFQDFEVPERISWPGTQQLTVHKLPGGARVIDAMGPDPGEISWSGIMLGGDASSRATQLAAIRDAGQIVPLLWGANSYQVVVSSFEPSEGFSRVDYRISCIVIPTAGPPGAPGLLDGIKADVNSALGFDIFTAGSDLLTAAQQVTSLATVLGGGNAALTGALSTVTAISGSVTLASGVASSLGSAASSVTAIRLAADGDLSAAAAAAPAGGLVASLTGFGSLVTSSGVGAQAAAAAGYIGRAAINAAGS